MILPFYQRTLVSVCLISFWAAGLYAQAPGPKYLPTEELKPGYSVTKQKTTVEVPRYRLRLKGGESVTIEVRTTMAPMGATLYDAGHVRVARPIPQQQPEELPVSIVALAEVDTDFEVDVVGMSGEYEIRVSQVRSATETDRKEYKAQTLYVDYAEGPLQDGKRHLAYNEQNLPLLEERVTILRETGDLAQLALALMDLGEEYQRHRRPILAVKQREEARDLFKTIKNVAEECRAHFALANFLIYVAGDFDKGIAELEEALTVSRSGSFKFGEYTALRGLGQVYFALGDRERASAYYTRSLEASRTMTADPRQKLMNEANIWIALGNIASAPREDERGSSDTGSDAAQITHEQAADAVHYYEEAAKVYRTLAAAQDRAGQTGEPDVLIRIGQTYLAAGDASMALDSFAKALDIYKNANYMQGHVAALVCIADAYMAKGERAAALERLQMATDLLNGWKLNAGAPALIASVAGGLRQAGELGKALALYERALQSARAIQGRSLSANVLYEISGIERDMGDIESATQRIRECIQITESIRADISAQELRTSYFANVKQYYNLYIDLLERSPAMKMSALEVSERARSRTLVDLLAGSGVDIPPDANPELAENERHLTDQITMKAYKRNMLNIAQKKSEADAVSREIEDLTQKRDEVRSRIYAVAAGIHLFDPPSPLTAAEIQKLLDPETVLLEFSLTDTRSYLWLVTMNNVRSFDLAGPREIQTKARKIYELLCERNRKRPGDTAAQRKSRIEAADTDYEAAASDLSNLLLGSAAEFINGKRLVIVADGVLNYVPFAALPSPGKDQKPAPLAASHEIVILPSASTLARLREQSKGRKPAEKLLAVFADPVFDASDNRINVTGKAKFMRVAADNAVATRDFDRALSDVDIQPQQEGGLSRLLFSSREAEAIFALTPQKKRLKRIDFDANKREVFSDHLENYQIVHFATHGLLDSRHPELSGVVLSLIDRDGRNIDGFLRLQEIYTLKLNADLVVLSACNTALGKEVRGEGLIGLTRGFMYAGAPRVVASLWKVDDSATAQLMSVFYKKMLAEKMRPPAALRAAQMELMKILRWRSPYYWAPFVLQGEWK